MHTTKPKGIPAGAFMAAFSSAGRVDLAGPKRCVHCKLNRARWDSIYCSDDCREQFLSALKETR